jgi:hypothetical protein
MIDHALRIRALHQQALENAEMEKLEKQAAPLLIAVCLVVLAIIGSAVADKVVAYYDLVEVNKAVVACMNGRTISLGDAELKCDVREYKALVAGLATGSQP